MLWFHGQSSEKSAVGLFFTLFSVVVLNCRSVTVWKRSGRMWSSRHVWVLRISTDVSSDFISLQCSWTVHPCGLSTEFVLQCFTQRKVHYLCCISWFQFKTCSFVVPGIGRCLAFFKNCENLNRMWELTTQADSCSLTAFQSWSQLECWALLWNRRVVHT